MVNLEDIEIFIDEYKKTKESINSNYFIISRFDENRTIGNIRNDYINLLIDKLEDSKLSEKYIKYLNELDFTYENYRNLSDSDSDNLESDDDSEFY